MQLAVLVWTGFFDVNEKKHLEKKGRDFLQQSTVAMAGLTQKQDHPHLLHTGAHTVVGYFRLCKTVIQVLHF